MNIRSSKFTVDKFKLDIAHFNPLSVNVTLIQKPL